VSETRGILLIADEAVERHFVSHLGRERVTCHREPYDALEDMARGRWDTVVISAPRGELRGLLRASRRLQAEARVLAVCPPAAEADVRPLTDEGLDDYLIHPPTRGELAALLRPPAGAPAPAAAPTAGGLSTSDLAALVAAATSPAELEARVAETIAELLGAPVGWRDADSLDPDRAPLLVTAGQPPRALLARDAAACPDEALRARLDELQQVLPALFESARRTESLHRLAITDHLTGAYNRRYFYHLTGRVLLRAGQHGRRAALLLYDFDNFKRYNDVYGHAAGDEILRDTAAMMRSICRAHDVVARIGGDEFAVLFWDPGPPRSPSSRPLETAQAMADRFRQAILQHKFPSLGPEAVGALTISGGLATFPADGQTCRELLRSADRALEAAKRAGKNIIKLVGE